MVCLPFLAPLMRNRKVCKLISFLNRSYTLNCLVGMLLALRLAIVAICVTCFQKLFTETLLKQEKIKHRIGKLKVGHEKMLTTIK